MKRRNADSQLSYPHRRHLSPTASHRTETLSSLNEAVKELSKDENIKVVIFVSDMKGYFFNHFDTSEFPNFLSQVGANAKPLWVELITNLYNAPFITIASIHLRTA